MSSYFLTFALRKNNIKESIEIISVYLKILNNINRRNSIGIRNVIYLEYVYEYQK